MPLICDYLRALDVPFTDDYTARRFRDMPFKTLFGISKLLEEYGVKSEGYLLTDKSEIDKLTPPFLAHTLPGCVVVTAVDNDKIGYTSQGVAESIPREEFFKAWDGNVLLSFPTPDSIEPQYTTHARIGFFMRAKKWILLFSVLFLLLYSGIRGGIFTHISTALITALDIAGLYFTYLLVQKSMNINNKVADRVCGVLQAGGCDSVLEMKASKFFGIFGWSEVGFAYFSVSLIAMLLFPATLPWLALCNLCCLPFTFWSIWYQKFRAHKWCTLCVSVQSLLWLLFFCYLGGGWIAMAWPPSFTVIVLGFCYLAVMLATNAVMSLITFSNKHTPDPDQQ